MTYVQVHSNVALMLPQIGQSEMVPASRLTLVSACLASPPLPGPVLSPIGAGDTVAGATFAAWLGNEADGDVPAAVAAFAFGLSRGAASCLTRENAAFDAATAEALLAGTEVTRA